ncbi:MAG: methionine synthase [Chloroflexota bacterium]|nr:methionine synthase [Chloroflexota bacterium]NOG63756.1 methionine synthase [Chloroflexota bacterium]GIK65010.1 MAG: methionine synthase [Chloroflexota bacterium]
MTKERIFTNRRYLDAIADHVLIFDGAMGTQIQRHKLTADDFGGEQYNGCNDFLVITRPDVIESIHASYFAAGCEVVETDTFRSNRHTLGEYGLQDRVLEINRAAASLARKVADRFEAETGIPRFVAGSIGPSGFLPSSDDPGLSAVTYDQLADIFGEQAQGLVEGGADVLLIETSQDILEVRAAVYGINRYFEQSGQRIPLQVQVTLDVSGRMLLGTEIGAALAILEGLPVDVIGLNCSTGPEHMRAPIKYLVENSTKPISVLPNAGLPINVDGEAVYPMLPEPFSEMMAEFVDWGVSVVGGCCGTTPEHITHLRDAVTKGQPHRHAPHREVTTEPQVASAMRNISLIQDPGPTLIGERVNSQGSRAVKKLLLNNDYDGILNIALDQVEGGAHILDVGVALTERSDEADQMRTLVKKLAMSVSAPLVIDTTEADVAEAALAVYPGRGIINSINLEDGLAKIERTVPIALKHGAAVIALTIDETGMAHTAERKLEIATRIHDICVNDYGMKPGDLIFDVLTFPVTTGQEELRNDAKETIEGIRQVKANLPGVLTSLGVSNVSFGISPAARAVLDSVFLYQCVQAGLDMAIVNPKHIKPYAEIPEDQRQLANDLIFNRHIDALPKFIQYFEENQIALESGAVADPTEGMTAEQALHWHIVHRKKDRVEELIDDCLTRQSAVGVLNNVLLPAMKEVGDKFGSGELILPFVLQSAEVMKKAVAYLENFLERKEGSTKGTVVLATVYGDVHDIGKNLVRTILSNNGYTVHDIGKQVPANTIIQAAIDYNADAIGLSALLVSTSKQMPLIVNELAKRNLHFPVLVGGAAINRRFGRRILFLEDGGEPYMPGVFYCKDAFEGLEVMDKLTDPYQREDFLEQIISEGYEELGRARPEVASAAGGKSTVQPAPDIPTPPFWGTRTILSIPLENVFPHLHKPELYRLSWGAKNTQGKEWEKLQADFEERLAWMQQEAIRKGTLKPQAVYGYFPAQSDGESLIIYDPKAWEADGDTVEIARFSFPRQPNGDFLCISDYFASVESGKVDVCPLQVVTAGSVATEYFDKLQGSDQYTEAYYFHGLAVQTAEATANFVNQHINHELGINIKRGKRYSWGYPACPDLDDHQIVFQLLPETVQKLGMELTAAYQLVPEQSTAAIVVHHPEAKYYSVGVSRVEQLVNA